MGAARPPGPSRRSFAGSTHRSERARSRAPTEIKEDERELRRQERFLKERERGLKERQLMRRLRNPKSHGRIPEILLYKPPPKADEQPENEVHVASDNVAVIPEPKKEGRLDENEVRRRIYGYVILLIFKMARENPIRYIRQEISVKIFIVKSDW